MSILNTKPLTMFSLDHVETSILPYPKFINEGLWLYEQALTPSEMHFFMNCVRQLGMEGSLLHLFDKNDKIWVPLNLTSEGNAGQFVSDDMPWYIVDKAFKAVQPYLKNFHLQASDVKVETCSIDLDLIRDMSPEGDYESQYAAWVKTTGKTRKQQLSKKVMDLLTVKVLQFNTPAEYFNAINKNCSEWLNRWNDNLDGNFRYYGELVSSFDAGAVEISIGNYSITYHFITDNKNFMFTDPLLKNGTVPEELGRFNNMYMVAHALVLKEALKRGVRYLDCGILYETKRFFGTPFNSVHLIDSIHDDEVPHKVLKTQITKARDAGKNVMFFLAGTDGAAESFAKNMESCTTHDLIEIPVRNIAQFGHLYQQRLTCTPFYFSLAGGNNVAQYATPDDYFFDLDYGLIEGMRKLVNARSLNHRFHSVEARRMEKDRLFAKDMATRIGILNPRYKRLTKDDYDVSDFGEKIVLKHNVHHLIGIFDNGSIDLAPFADGQHVVEEFIGAPDREIAYTFAINNEFVMPLQTMWENNRMWANGSKTGSVATMHKAGITDAFGLEVAEKLSNLYEHVSGMFGWVDVSFMERDGKMYLTEFMFRMGHSNTCTIMRQMKTPYMEFINALEEKDYNFQMQWHSKFACGIDLHGVPLMSGFSDSWVRIDGIVNSAVKQLESGVFFNYMHPYSTRTNEAVYSEHSSWYGVVSALADTAEEAQRLAESNAAKFNLPMVQYRVGAFDGMDIK